MAVGLRSTVYLIVFWLCCLRALALQGTCPHIIYIGGWTTENKELTEQCELLREIFPEAEIERLEWPANGEFAAVLEAADRMALEEAVKIARLSSEGRESIVVIGHSLGGRMAIRILAELHRKKMCVSRGIFLGPAIDGNDKDISEAIQASKGQNILIYQPNDVVLRDEYSAYMKKDSAALGSRGYLGDYSGKNLRQICINEGSSYSHLSILYLKKLQEKIDSEVDEKPVKEIHGFRHEMDNPTKTMEIYPKVVDECMGWRILLPRGKAIVETLDLFGWIEFNYLLCDPEMRCRAKGTRAEMQEALEDVKRILLHEENK